MTSAAQPLVSVLTPSFNQGRYIRDTIESVLSQDYPAIEHIVIDGASTDATMRVLREYEGRIKFVSERDRGQGDALNKALSISRGSIVGWLNSDDFYVSRQVVTSAVEVFCHHATADVVYGHALYVNDSNVVVKVSLRPQFKGDRLRRFDFISQPATFFRREVAPTPLVDPELNYVMDYALWLRLLDDRCGFHRLDRIMAAMRHHSEAKSVVSLPLLLEEDERVRCGNYGRRRVVKRILLRDFAVMAGMKMKGLLWFAESALDSKAWCVPLSLPPILLRPLYQVSILGSPGSALLFPSRMLKSSRRRAMEEER